MPLEPVIVHAGISTALAARRKDEAVVRRVAGDEAWRLISISMKVALPMLMTSCSTPASRK